MKLGRLKFTVKLLVILLSLGVTQPIYGKISALNEDIDQLELEVEVEDQELFDEKVMTNEENKLNRHLKSEAVALKKNINQMNREKYRAENKHKRLTQRRKSSQKVYNRVYSKALKVEKIKNNQVLKTNKIQQEVDILESDALRRRNQKLALQKEIKSLNRNQRRLIQRKKNALRIIKKHKNTLRRLKTKKRKQKNKVAKLGFQVKKLENKAIAKQLEVKLLR